MPSSDLTKSGVLISLFTDSDDWKPCTQNNAPCWNARDRISATLMYYRPKGTTQQPERAIYMHNTGGMVVAPNNDLVLCGYPEDGRTQGQTCGGSRGGGCVPGCTTGWCNPQHIRNGDAWCDGHAWKRSDFGKMLDLQRANVWAGYNEIVLDAYQFAERLPRDVEAFFLLTDPQCGSLCKRATRDAHRLFLQTFPESSAPLLAFKTDALERPFSDAPSS